MIAQLSGKVSFQGTNYIILDVAGVGYKVFCSSGGSAVSTEVTVFTHHYIREDQQTLYGFASMEELGLFELLITVNGVGPKAAMAIMSSAAPKRITSAIARGDAAIFKAISGIGPKVAAKIIVELKSKVGGVGGYELGEIAGSAEVVDALEGLGYRKPEIAAVLKNMPPEITNADEKIKWALREMGKRH